MKTNATVLESPLVADAVYKAISLRMKLAILSRLDETARNKGMTRSSCIIDAVNDWLDEQNK